MRFVIPLFPRFTALDAAGPYEVLSRLPGAQVGFAAVEPGLIGDASGGMRLEAPVALSAIDSADVLVVPGGPGTRRPDPRLVDWIRAIHATTELTTSVCTGSLLLGAAGLLFGLPATSHWYELPRLADFGAIPTSQRVVFAGKIATAAGVSAGIDFSLQLAAMFFGDDVARAVQLAIEYDPDPPFDAGSVATAPPALVERVRGAIRARLEAAARG